MRQAPGTEHLNQAAARRGPRERAKSVGFLNGIRAFFAEMKAEFIRVSWPTRDATVKSTGIVVIVTLALAVYLGVMDVGLATVARHILGR